MKPEEICAALADYWGGEWTTVIPAEGKQNEYQGLIQNASLATDQKTAYLKGLGVTTRPPSPPQNPADDLRKRLLKKPHWRLVFTAEQADCFLGHVEENRVTENRFRILLVSFSGIPTDAITFSWVDPLNGTALLPETDTRDALSVMKCDFSETEDDRFRVIFSSTNKHAIRAAYKAASVVEAVFHDYKECKKSERYARFSSHTLFLTRCLMEATDKQIGTYAWNGRELTVLKNTLFKTLSDQQLVYTLQGPSDPQHRDNSTTVPYCIVEPLEAFSNAENAIKNGLVLALTTLRPQASHPPVPSIAAPVPTASQPGLPSMGSNSKTPAAPPILSPTPRRPGGLLPPLSPRARPTAAGLSWDPSKAAAPTSITPWVGGLRDRTAQPTALSPEGRAR